MALTDEVCIYVADRQRNDIGSANPSWEIRDAALREFDTLAKEYVLSGPTAAEKRDKFNLLLAAWVANMCSILGKLFEVLCAQAPAHISNAGEWALSRLSLIVREELSGSRRKHVVSVAMERVAKSISDITIWDDIYGDYGVAMFNFKQMFESAMTQTIECLRHAALPRPVPADASGSFLRPDETLKYDDVVGPVGFGDPEAAAIQNRLYDQLLGLVRRAQTAAGCNDAAKLEAEYAEFERRGFSRILLIPYVEGKQKPSSAADATKAIIGKLFREHSDTTIDHNVRGKPSPKKPR